MANYQFLDAYGSVLTAASSVIGGVNYPIVKMPDLVTINPTSISGTVGASIIGTVPVVGSVAVLQGTNPWIVNMPSPSVVAFQQAGSVMAVAASVITAYAEDTPHATGDAGFLNLNVRNDTLASVTSADGDYGALAVGPSGEGIVANAPFTKWVQGNASVFTGVSVMGLLPQGSSVFTYITALQLVNASANNVYVTFTGGLGGVSSILGYLPAPANSGAIPFMLNGWKTGQNSGVSASVSGVASIYVSLQGFISKS